MNKIYNVIWNRELGRHVVTSELATRRSKSKTVRAATMALSCLLTAPALTLFSMPAAAYVAGDGAVQGAAGNTVVGDGASGTDTCLALSNGQAPDGTPSPLTNCLNSTAVGTQAKAAGGATALGEHANADSDFATAVGAATTAGDYSTAVGAGATADNHHAVAVGQGAYATGGNSTTVGTNAWATGEHATTVGYGGKAAGADSTSLGFKANATGDASLAAGANTSASSQDAIALGRDASASGEKSIALGSDSQVTGKLGMAIGAYAESTADGIALGSNAGKSTVDSTGSVMVGQGAGSFNETAHNTAVGASAGRNVKGDVGYNTAIGTMNTGANITGDYNTSVGHTAGYATVGSMNNSIGVNAGQNSIGDDNVSIGAGSGAWVEGSNNVALGSGANNTGTKAARLEVNNAVAVGVAATTEQDNAVAIGAGAVAKTIGGVALGDASVADREAGIAGYLPSTANAAQQAAIAATTGTWNAVSVGDVASGQFRQITGVAAGSDDSDAVNVAQLKAVGDATSDEIDAAKTHYYSVNDNGAQGGNYDNDGATATGAMAAGVNASASGGDSIAVGSNAVANIQRALAIGHNAQATGLTSIALGEEAFTQEKGSVAIGNLSRAAGWQATAIGDSATSTGQGALSVGANSSATDNGAAAIGFGATATSAHSLALGDGATADKGSVASGWNTTATNASIASGTAALATGLHSAALGHLAASTGEDSVAVGESANASGASTLAIGANTTATSTYGVALGSYSVADRDNGVAGYVPSTADAAQEASIIATTSTLGAVSVGNAATGQFRQITGVAAGTEDSDATNVAQLKAVAAAASDDANAAKTHYYSVNDNGAQGANYDNDGATGINAMAAGVNATADGEMALAMGYDSHAAGKLGMAIGAYAESTADGIALGSNAGKSTVDSTGSVMVGQGAGSFNETAHNTAVGASAGRNVKGDVGYNTAIGTMNTGANITGDYNTSVGHTAGYATVGSMNNSIGVNAGQNSIGDDNVSIGAGSGAWVEGSNNVALGSGANNTGTKAARLEVNNAVAVGVAATTEQDNAVAIGAGAVAKTIGGVALGDASVADREAGIAGYLPPTANAAQQAAIAATTGTWSAVSVGDVASGQFRQITGVAAGTEDSDATNVAQLKAVAAAASDDANAAKTHYYSVNDNGVQGANYDNDGATGINALAAGVNARASVEGGIALGSSSVSNRAAGLASYVPAGASDGQRAAIAATTSTQGAFSIGDADAGIFRQITGVAAGTADSDAVNVAQLKAVSIAAEAGAVHYYSVNDNGSQGANYDNTGATGTNAMAAGVAATATGEAAVAMGNEAQANSGNSVAVGNGANASAEGGVALGGGSVADREAGTAGYVPASANATQQAAIAATTSTQGAVSVGDAANGQFRQIAGVAAGSEDSDAVNVAQLKAAGAATSDEIEASKTHYYSVNDGGKQSANYNNDGATGNNAIAAGTNASAAGKSAVAMGDGAQAAAASSVAIGNNAKATTSNSVALGSNSVASRDNSVSVGTAGNERQITNVAAGTADTDAVNVSQLEKSTGDINNRIDNTYNSLRHDLKDQDDTLSAGIAGAMAAAALPQPYSPGASMVSAGAGNYRGQSSLAIGVSTISDNGKWVSKLAGTADSQGEFGVSVGVGYQW